MAISNEEVKKIINKDIVVEEPSLFSELREVYQSGPLHIPQLTHLEWFCIGLCIVLLVAILIPIIFHGTIPFYKDSSQIVYVQQIFDVPNYSPTIGLLDNGEVGYLSYHS